MSVLGFILIVAALAIGLLAVVRLRQKLPLFPTFRRAAPATAAEPSTPAEGETIVQRQPRTLFGGRAILLIVVALIIVSTIVMLPRGLFAPRTQFYVLVAPFRNPDGSITTAGQNAARDLATTLSQTNSLIIAHTIDRPPESSTAAAQRLNQEQADALIYGTITDGGMLDQESLTPMLAYQPHGTFAPAAWAGYLGRFSMPTAYALSAQPINGKAVLPRLILAMAQYGAGDYDPAFSTLSDLLNEYPALATPLPQALRGNMLWALGSYRQAADAYRSTGVMDIAPGQPTEMALLANNLGAILQDSGDSAGAEAAFAKTVSLLNNQDLPALRLNVGLGMIAQQRYDEAIAAIEPIVTTESPANVRFALVDACIGARKLDQARAALADARNLPFHDSRQTIEMLRDQMQQQLNAEVEERDIRLRLAQVSGTTDPLLWSYIGQRTINSSDLQEPYNDLRNLVEQSDEAARRWRRDGVAADADQRPFTAQIANAQATLADKATFRRQTLLAGIELQLGSNANQDTTIVASAWDILSGRQMRTSAAQRELTNLLKVDPSNANAQVLLGMSYLNAGNDDQARQAFSAAAQLAPNAPEPTYGLAQLDLKTDRNKAKDDLREAIRQQTTFTPAREQLALLSEQDSDWPTAIEQRRWLADNRATTEDKLALATTLQQSGAFAQAENELLPLANGGNTPAMLQLSKLYVAANNPTAALDTLARARKSDPNNGEVAFAYGELLSQQDQPAEARKQFEQAAQLAPNYGPARVKMGEYYTADGQYRQAAREYDAALRLGENDPPTLLAVGRVFLLVGENDRALSAYKQAAETTPDDPQVHLGLAHSYVALNQPSEANKAAQKALDLAGGHNAEARVILGDLALMTNQIDQATDLYLAARNDDPNSPEPYLGLGRAEASRGEWAKASDYFQQAIAKDPNAAEAHVQNGEALLNQQKISEARAEFNTALGLRPSYTQAMFGIAQTEAANGDFAGAHAQIEKTLKINPNYAEALLLNGVVYEREGNSDRARINYTKAIQANRDFAEAYYRRAMLSIGNGDLNAARPDLEDAIRKRDNFPEAHYWLGRTQLSDGKLDQALKEFETAISQTGDNYPDASFYRAVALERKGDLPSAYTAYRSTLDRAPGSTWATEAQAAIDRIGTTQ